MATTDRIAAAQAIEAFLRALGHDPTHNPDLRRTGQRVADAWLDEILAGEGADPEALLRAESTPCDRPQGLVVLRDLRLSTMCPHHLLPALGTATIAYLPGDRIAGLGTLTRVLDALSRRLTLQEHIGEQFTEALLRGLGARGAACALRLQHACLSIRGARQHAWVETLASAGALAPDGSHHALLGGLLRG